jgi:arginyl-tRNA synthetase
MNQSDKHHHETRLASGNFDPLLILRERFVRACQVAFPGVDLPAPVITPSTNEKFGDFQCNSAMTYAKLVAKPPRAVAEAMLANVDLADLIDGPSAVSIAGPGFLNITLSNAAVSKLAQGIDTPELGVVMDADAPITVVDLCGVNLAKQMHIGHLRSSVIGDTIARVLEATRRPGSVIRQNHVGDWGLPIAMVTDALIQAKVRGEVNLETLTLDHLDALYKKAKKDCETCDDQIEFARAWGMGPKVLAELEAENDQPAQNLQRAKLTLVRLQSGDSAIRAVWQRIFDVTMGACLATCQRLNVRIDNSNTAGESFYEHALGPLVAQLEASGVASVDQGALVVRLEDQGIAEPCLIRKSDGGFLYATTDLAAIKHRTTTLGAQRVVYCVDSRQSLHFAQVFASARKCGIVGPEVLLEHASFGTILGEDGRPFKSRSGESVKLGDVIDEAVAKASQEVDKRNPTLDADERTRIAQAVAIAAIRYTDLSTERVKDYVFSLERMVRFEGDTGPYLLYALARVRSILRKAAEQGLLTAAQDGQIDVGQSAEKALVLTMLKYSSVLSEVARTSEPHRLCNQMYAIASSFASFFDACPVLAAGDERTKASRVRLCQLAERMLAHGLTLLGFRLVDRM